MSTNLCYFVDTAPNYIMTSVSCNNSKQSQSCIKQWLMVGRVPQSAGNLQEFRGYGAGNLDVILVVEETCLDLVLSIVCTIHSTTKIECARLDWVKRNQKAIRAEKYSGLLGAHGHTDNDLARAGRKVILPPSVYGSPQFQFYNECFQDAMTLVRKLGKPDLLNVTSTCNPKWEEIQNALNKGESYTDRPDYIIGIHLS